MAGAPLQLLLERSCAKHPEKIALRTSEGDVSYSELLSQTERMAGRLLAADVQTTDRIAWMLPNSLDAVVLLLAIYRVGAIGVPINVRYAVPEVVYMVNKVRAKMLFLPASKLEVLQTANFPSSLRVVALGSSRWEQFHQGRGMGLRRAEESQAALILFTSGTTGHPKGVVHSYGGCWAALMSSMEALDFQEEDVVLVGKPFCHAGGLLTQLLPALTRGCTVGLAMLPEPKEAIELLRRWEVTCYALLASHLLDFVSYLEQEKCALPKLRRLTGSGDAVPLELQQRCRAMGLRVFEGCGLTEIGGYYAMQRGEARPGSIGHVAPGVRVRLVEGEVLLQTASATLGYWEDPEATKALFQEGWLRTGDLARLDEDGHLWFVGRRKLVIVRRGSNIAPAAVERVLAAHPQVHASVVVGVPDVQDGQVPVAWIMAKGEVNEEVLREYVKGELASFERPVRFLFRQDMPYNSVGKFDRAKLQMEAEAHLKAYKAGA